MKLKKASINDLKEIKVMYAHIIKEMHKNKNDIWDEVYPIEFLEEDIINGELYVMVDEEQTIVAAFSLPSRNNGESHVEWSSPTASCVYLEKFAINVDYLRKGYGKKALCFAIEQAKKLEKTYLRLFVVEDNIPAIYLYEKMGFKKVKGIYKEVIDESLSFNEWGYEISLEEKVNGN